MEGDEAWEGVGEDLTPGRHRGDIEVADGSVAHLRSGINRMARVREREELKRVRFYSN